MPRMDLIRHLLLVALRGGGGNKNISASNSGEYDSGNLPAGRNWHMASCASCERNIMGKIM